ncbi:hypothetical protein ApDm4_2748 [Acetobacter pomorum]|nr:hypothetical protein ApDm4_2748 [Acetobacter pomorum]
MCKPEPRFFIGFGFFVRRADPTPCGVPTTKPCKGSHIGPRGA